MFDWRSSMQKKRRDTQSSRSLSIGRPDTAKYDSRSTSSWGQDELSGGRPPSRLDIRPLTPKDSTKDLHDAAVPQFQQLDELNAQLGRMQMQSSKSCKRKKHPLRQLPPRPPTPPTPTCSDVLVVGAGPAGLMLTCNLIRFGVNAEIIDNRSEKTMTGRADGLQPKTIETLKQMRLADRLLLKGVKVFDINIWLSTTEQTLQRVGKEVQFPPSLDCLDPYLLLAHQGFVEDIFLKDIMERGVTVRHKITFVDYQTVPGPNSVEVVCKSSDSQAKTTLNTRYLVGCDGSHSNVRKAIGARPVGSSYDAVWGVIDGVLETDFPDIYSKTVIHNEEIGSVLLHPRERNMTRLYIELKRELREGARKDELDQDFVIRLAEEVFEPYYIRWKSVEWFGRYQIGQKTASKFADDENKVFIAGDATHTQSPNASQGMNHSMHDSWNLGWKLNLAVRGLAKPSLLATYEEERRQVAEDLMDFDHEHAEALASGDTGALLDNFHRNVRFISGFGADYGPNVLNVPQKGCVMGGLRAGSLLPPSKVTRKIDSNPVDIQLDIPVLGQFRMYFFAQNLDEVRPFLDILSEHALSYSSIMGKLTCATNASYISQPPYAAASDEIIRPERYTTISGLFTFALVLQSRSHDFEIEDLPPLWRDSKFTCYIDNVPHLDTKGQSCTEKWFGAVTGSEVGIAVVRPDGYVGTVGRFVGRAKENGAKATKWLDGYLDAFLTAGY
ncbi:hypothetical protein EJ08DRAFT_150720 [Tothia fuscella]|uniref:Phenol 2-monooxygenase n=1 Tax=Tothia fuscella TaxID=1048955 RepID=A0A9P4U531_9PEZI|nr:hypothetical protein EJ08DRAFT_150720 [Tothia fuscella]